MTSTNTSLVTPPSVVSFSREEIAAVCHTWGSSLWLKGLDVDGPRLLWALSGVESSFGANCAPRHELAYCTGRYSENPQMQVLTKAYGHAAHASFGPWQLMLVCAQATTKPEDTAASPEMFARSEFAAMKTVSFINTRILKGQGATTVAEIADAYNSGNWRDANVPHAYVDRVLGFYNNEEMPQ
jgi:hypothetical protein